MKEHDLKLFKGEEEDGVVTVTMKESKRFMGLIIKMSEYDYRIPKAPGRRFDTITQASVAMMANHHSTDTRSSLLDLAKRGGLV